MPPLPVLVLDIIGAVLAGLGLAELTADVGLVPESLRFAHFELVMILVGFALMIPMVRHSIRRARERAAQARNG